MCDWKMVLVLVGGVKMSSDMAFFTDTDIMCGMCGLSVPAIHIMYAKHHYIIIFSFLFYRNNDLLNPD